MRVFALTALVVLLIAPLAQAGSVDDPEVTDPSGDGAPGGKDILKVWFEDGLSLDSAGDEVIVVAFEIASDGPDLSSLYALHERVRIGFKGVYEGAPAGAEFYVYGEPNVGTTSQTGEARFICKFGISATQGGSQDVAAELSVQAGEWDGKTFRCLLPLGYIGGDAARGNVLSDIWAKYELVQRGPNAGGDAAGVNTHVLDRAPNSGFGRNYQIVAPEPVAPDIVVQNITEFPFLNETTEPVSGVFQYNWTGNGSAFRFLGEVLSGNLTLNATANGESIFSWNGTEGFDHTMEAAHACVDEAVTPVSCEYAFVYTLTDFVGMYGIEFAKEKTPGETNATEEPEHHEGEHHVENGGNETGNETIDDTPAGKESPAVAVPLLVLALVIVVRRRN